MPRPQSLIAELRALEARQAQGLSSAERARLAELRAVAGPAPGPQGFDVNAAAAAIRDSLVPGGVRPPGAPDAPVPLPPPETDIGALGPGTPPLETEPVAPEALEPVPAEELAPLPGLEVGAPAGYDLIPPSPAPPGDVPVTQDYDVVPAFDAGSAPPAEALGPAADLEPGWQEPSAPSAFQAGGPAPWDSDATGSPAEAGAAAPWDPGAAASWDPNAAPADWDPNAAAPGADPGAAARLDPSAAAQWDPNAAPADWDPNAVPGADPGAAAQWDPGAAAAWDPNAAPALWDPNAAAPGADPGAAAQLDPSAAAQWDPNAAPADWDPNAAAPGADPGAAAQLDPSAAAQWDPNAAPALWDPNAAAPGADPGAAGQWDPNAPTWEPNAPPAPGWEDPAAAADWGSGVAQPAAGPEPALGWGGEVGNPPGQHPAAGQGPESDTASWDLSGGAAPAMVVPDEGDPGATAAWSVAQIAGSRKAPAPALEQALPAGWADDVEPAFLDELQLESEGSFAAPAADAPPRAAAEPWLAPGAAPEPAAGELPVELGAPTAPPAEVPLATPPPDVAGRVEQPRATGPEEVSEDQILEVGDDVVEVSEADDIPTVDAVELAEEEASAAAPSPGTELPPPETALPSETPQPWAPEPAGPPAAVPSPAALSSSVAVPSPVVSSPVAEPLPRAVSSPVAEPLPWEEPPPAEEPRRADLAPAKEVPAAAAPPPPPAEPAAAEQARADAVEPRPLQDLPSPPAARAPAQPAETPLPAAPPGEAVPLESLAIDEGPVETALEPPPPARRILAGVHRVVVHTVEGQVKRGSLSDPDMEAGELLLAPQPSGAPEPLPAERVRAIFFMLAAGDKPPPPKGVKVRVTFKDGRQVAGFSPDYDPDATGFFMIPADTRTNTARIWVYRSAVRQVAVS